jgi:hypothetical protein
MGTVSALRSSAELIGGTDSGAVVVAGTAP